MFVMLARAMSLEEFGNFSFSFSVATLLGVIALAGQQQFILRILPNTSAERETPHPLVFAIQNMVLAFTVVLICMLSWQAISPSSLGKSGGAILLLIVALALSDFLSAVLRVQGRLMLAVAPRDVIWRSFIIGYCFIAITLQWQSPSAVFILTIAAASLICLCVLQMMLCNAWPKPMFQRLFQRVPNAEWSIMTRYFWLTSTLNYAGPTFSVIIIGLMLSKEDAGPFFAALKTAQVMSLVLLAVNIVASPLISKSMADKDLKTVMSICRFTSLLAGISSVSGFIILLIWGHEILTIFGSEFWTAYGPLLIMSAGFVVNGLNGSSGVLLAMSGHEKGLALILVVTNAISLLTLPIFCWLGGLLGAAISIALTSMSWNLWSLIYSRRKLGIDPSVLSFVFPPKLLD